MNERKSISLEELKKIELGVLVEVDGICRANGFRYSVCGGTLLGAVRHGGFIPWDDDIDVLMPRPDYERFIACCRDDGQLGFYVRENAADEEYLQLYAKACAKGTVLVEENASGGTLGVNIDIFPIDGLGDSVSAARKTLMKTAFRRELLVASMWQRFERSRTHSWYYEPIRLALYILSRFASSRKLVRSIEADIDKDCFDESAYCGCICGSYREKEIMKRIVFSEYDDITFEGKTVRAMKHYDMYLSQIFGDYMKLPPEAERVSHHVFTAYYQ